MVDQLPYDGSKETLVSTTPPLLSYTWRLVYQFTRKTGVLVPPQRFQEV